MSQSDAESIAGYDISSQGGEDSLGPTTDKLHRADSLDAYRQSELESTISLALPQDENELSEQQLRELYDNEEIERFLHLFSTYVTEVQAPDTPSYEKENHQDDVTSYYSRDSVEGNERTTHLGAQESILESEDRGIAKEIAYRYIVPVLPPARPCPPFTFSRLRLATERLYLAIIPIYGPFFQHLYELAGWENPRTSFIYCAVFWTLWWHNLVAPALIFRILFSLLKRRIFTYPSLEDLRKHREEVQRADEFGEQISARLSAKASNMKEIWRLFKLLDRTTKLKSKSRKVSTEKDKQKTAEASTENLNDEADTTILDSNDDTKEVQDFKRIGLSLMEEVADLHERVRNIFIWRRPSSSMLYGGILGVIFVLSFLPAKYIVKGVLFSLGFLFWHVIPVIMALTSSERQRLPPLFDDTPTDAEYAMELISQRIAAGLDVKPNYKKHQRSDTSDSIHTTSEHNKGSLSQSGTDTSIDWKKWGDRMAIGKSAVNDIKRLKPGSPWAVHEVWPPRHPFLSGAIGIAQPQVNNETHTYPCQRGSTPGLLTLTHNSLLFTPLISQTPKVVIPLNAVKGVKKAGLLKGINIRWNESIEGQREQKEDKFAWVGSRDELFARLVGGDNKRWMKV